MSLAVVRIVPSLQRACSVIPRDRVPCPLDGGRLKTRRLGPLSYPRRP